VVPTHTFAAVGLEVKAKRARRVDDVRPNFRWPAHHWSIQPPTKRGTCDVRCQTYGTGGVCLSQATEQHRCLKRTHERQHPEVMDFEPPSLYSPSPATRTTAFQRHLERRRRDGVSWSAKPGEHAPHFLTDITTKPLFQWRHDRTKVRTLHGTSNPRMAKHQDRSFAASVIRDGKPGHGR
jgi:hypothetical protein